MKTDINLTDYFKGDQLAESVWKNKYQFNNETIDEFKDRIIKEFQRKLTERFEELDSSKFENLSELGKRWYTNKDHLFSKIEDFIKHDSIIPGGSVLSGIGTNQPVSLSNCTVIPGPKDSIESIFDTARDMSQLFKRRAGVGFDLSNIRPRGASVNNSAKSSDGVVSWMELFSKSTECVSQSGRRGALLLSIDVNHPDILEFITSKQDLSKITGANISVKLNDAFIKAVEDDKDYYLSFPIDKVPYTTLADDARNYEYNKLYSTIEGYYKKVKAKEIWNKLIDCSWATAEPGIFNWGYAMDNDPASVYNNLKAISSNPCQPSWATVLTKSGIRQFKDVNIGDEIWSSDGWTTIIDKSSSGIKSVYEYRTTAGSFYGTENHRLISKGNKIEAKDCINIDILGGYINPNKEGNHILDYDTVVDGLLIGDGSIHTASNNLIYLCIGENDQDYFKSEELKLNILKHRPEIKPYAYEVKSNLDYTELPLTYNRVIPDRYFYGDVITVRSFLRGLYTANGSVISTKKSKRVTLKTSSPKLRDQVQIMLSSLGIRSYYTTNNPKKVLFKNGEYECRESYDINITTDRDIFCESIGFIQSYKMIKLRETLMESSIIKSSKNHQIISSDKISEEEVFNITVNNNSHTYWTGGMNVSNCGEQMLAGYDSCRLIAVNLFSLIDRPFKETEFCYEMARDVFYICQILGDLIIDLELEAIDRILDKINKDSSEYYLWEQFEIIAKKGRRTGCGITGYADYLAGMGFQYGDNKATEEIFKIKFQSELQSSIDMAILFGPFEAWDRNNEYYSEDDQYQYLKGFNSAYQFILDNYPKEVERMQTYGRRNVSWSTVPPAGTISIIAKPHNTTHQFPGVSSGIEPVFSLWYTRRRRCNEGETPDFTDNLGNPFKEYRVIHPQFKEWVYVNYDTISLEECSEDVLKNFAKLSPYWNQQASNIDYHKRVETQALIQKYITASISSTVNLEENVTKETISDIYLEAFEKGCKGLTVYRESCRSGILVNKESTDKQTVNNLKRPDELDCHILHFKNGKKDWIAFVGIRDEYPFELFSGPRDIDIFPVPSNIKQGKIIRVKDNSQEHARYDFVYTDSYGYENRLGGLSRIFDREYWNYARFVSALLRGGTELTEIIRIIDGLEFETRNLNSWKSGVIRAIKEYIPDGEEVKGEKCPECGEKIIFEAGCKRCSSCDWSRCL